MLIDLSDILSADHRTAAYTLSVDMKEVRTGFGVFPVQSASQLELKVAHSTGGKLSIEGRTDLVLILRCDRCLADVPTGFSLDFQKSVDLLAKTETEGLDEKNYIDGHNLDVYKLLFNEILVGWPMKTLCSEDCKGLCSVCGCSLNERDCGCERAGSDPRMSVIRDVFKNFKEV